jgi:hypothetical protein
LKLRPIRLIKAATVADGFNAFDAFYQLIGSEAKASINNGLN